MTKAFRSLYFICALAIGVLGTGCNRDDDDDENLSGPDVEFYGLTSDNRLVRYNGQNTGTPLATAAITGLQSGESILGIDFRPATGQLFGIGSSSRLYIINPSTGAAVAVGSTATTTGAAFTPVLSGTPVAFDFNPTVDRIRLVTSNGQNLRLNPETGTVAATDGTINGASVNITGAAYTQSRAGVTTTALYYLDVANDKLYRSDNPNSGAVAEVGNLGVNADAGTGFDISSDSANTLAVLNVSGKSGLYSISLSTGAATKRANFSEILVGIAIPTTPVAYAINSTNALIIMNPTNGEVAFTKPITGLQASENILGIDMRPATGQLFALGSTSRLYTINTNTGAATLVGTGVLTTPLVGTEFGFDFNPTVDRIRVVSNTGQNLRLNPIDGAVAAVDGAINPATSIISASAYTNNFANATTTTLFNIDASTDRLVQQNPPNNGTIVDIGALGVNVEAANGFDIGGVSNTAYGLFTVGGTTRVYAVNLTTGAATAGATVAGATTIRAMALGLGL